MNLNMKNNIYIGLFRRVSRIFIEKKKKIKFNFEYYNLYNIFSDFSLSRARVHTIGVDYYYNLVMFHRRRRRRRRRRPPRLFNLLCFILIDATPKARLVFHRVVRAHPCRVSTHYIHTSVSYEYINAPHTRAHFRCAAVFGPIGFRIRYI